MDKGRWITIHRWRFVDPTTWKPKHLEDVVFKHPDVVGQARRFLMLDPSCCWTHTRTMLVREFGQRIKVDYS